MQDGRSSKKYLVRLSAHGAVEQRFLLSENQQTVLGREPQCQIRVDPFLYGSVSRQHAKIEPVSDSDSRLFWQVHNLSSTNGTYLNGQRLQGCEVLRRGDRITLGKNGPEFFFDCQSIDQESLPEAISNARSSSSASNLASNNSLRTPLYSQNDITRSQLFPIFSHKQELSQKAYLAPVAITIVFVILMFSSLGKGHFNFLLAAFIAGAIYYFIYQLCGKDKPWWVLLGSAMMTAVMFFTPMWFVLEFIFRDILPGGGVFNTDQNFISALVAHFFGAGLLEELFKALPVLAAFYIGKRLDSPRREQIGVWEPLDGILLGTASAVGFTLLETLGQYVPTVVNKVGLESGIGTGELLGLQLLIPRILGAIAGHIAWSGYLGFFIGLWLLRPSKRWKLLGVGYLTASFLHALWNASPSLGLFGSFVALAVGVTSYAFLVAAILKARKLSPTRSRNFATSFNNNYQSYEKQ